MPLVVESLSLRRGERLVLERISFRADEGEAVRLTGPNGAGKTTLLRALAGLLAPVEGAIRLDGTAAEADAAVAESCHFVGHLNGVKPSLTVIENVVFWARYLGGAPAEAGSALERFGLGDLTHVPAAYLSAGQRRRLGLARLLVVARPVWLLDEPAVSLDTASQRLLASAVDGHLAGGGIVVAATHQPLGFARERELRLGAVAADHPASEIKPRMAP